MKTRQKTWAVVLAAGNGTRQLCYRCLAPACRRLSKPWCRLAGAICVAVRARSLSMRSTNACPRPLYGGRAQARGRN